MKRIPFAAAFAIVSVIIGILVFQRVTTVAADSIVGIPSGDEAVEFAGVISQDGANIVSYGYITHIYGLDDASLFNTSDPALRNETTARFTYVATATLTSRSIVSTVFATNSAGLWTTYFNPAPAGNFSNPGSFSGGAAVSTYGFRTQDVLSVIAPNQGVLAAVATLNQISASPFTLGSQNYRLGYGGLHLRSWGSGTGIRTDPVAPKSTVFVAGNMLVTVERGPLAVPFALQRASGG